MDEEHTAGADGPHRRGDHEGEGPHPPRTPTANPRTPVSRRRLAAGILALGATLALNTSARAATRGGRNAAPEELRYGSAVEAGLLEAPLQAAAAQATQFLGPSPVHPWYAGAVILAGRGRTVALHHALGEAVRYADYEESTNTGLELPADQRISVTRDTVFDLASLTKLFTALLTVQQIERGTLELEAPAVRHLPEFAGGGRDGITVRQLLTHTTGLRAWVPLYREESRARQLKLLCNVRPQNAPGTVYRYSDINLIALQLLLERVTARPLETLLHEEITAPLGMRHTRFNPPPSWRPRIAATEVARPPWSALDRGLVWGRVHDENAHALGGVAGHAGLFGTAWDLAVLARTLLDGGHHPRARILSPASVELLFTDFNTAFPGDDHGLGFELNQHWYMGAMATPRSAGHTGFTGTSLVLDPSTDTFLILLGNSVHPVRTWRAGSAPRVACANLVARAVPVRSPLGGTAWFSGMAPESEGTLTLPVLTPPTENAALSCLLWWDTVPGAGTVTLEASVARKSGDAVHGEDSLTHRAHVEDGPWSPLAFTTVALAHQPPSPPVPHPDGQVEGWSGRGWHRATAALGHWRGLPVRLRWRYTYRGRYVGRGAYLDALSVIDGPRTVFEDSPYTDASAPTSRGWSRSPD
ncbi:serine hydrolase [Streptomyces sp. NPDC006879]|uniref:serine hydrolase n=1 Tax=Streptomyces sp. NPDC006879 TaxID=3364767 RepID=UPI003685679F